MHSSCWILVLTLLSTGCWATESKQPRHTFGYDGEHGPSNWANEFKTCSGKYQSPIDIEEHLVTQVRLPPLKFQGFQEQPTSNTLTNNGHTVMLELNMTTMASVTGGPLRGNYIFKQPHFHWGDNDTLGSEDTINNHTFPLELHMVFYNQAYDTFEEATLHKDGLAVLAVFYEIYQDENMVYSEIVHMLPDVTDPTKKAHLSKPITLDSLLPTTRHLYFTYNGSLTTPPCLEVVTWIDFKTPILLSHAQVEAFRKLRSEEGMMSHNYRPVQPLEGRPVWFNVADDYSQGSADSLKTSVGLVVFISIVLVLLQG